MRGAAVGIVDLQTTLYKRAKAYILSRLMAILEYGTFQCED